MALYVCIIYGYDVLCLLPVLHCVSVICVIVLQLEQPLLDMAQVKMLELERSILLMEATAGGGVASDTSGGGVTSDTLGNLATEVIHMAGKECSSNVRPSVDLSFIREAVQELLKCRRVLKATYCYGYYLTGLVSKKQFEHMQVCVHDGTSPGIPSA